MLPPLLPPAQRMKPRSLFFSLTRRCRPGRVGSTCSPFSSACRARLFVCSTHGKPRALTVLQQAPALDKQISLKVVLCAPAGGEAASGDPSGDTRDIPRAFGRAPRPDPGQAPRQRAAVKEGVLGDL